MKLNKIQANTILLITAIIWGTSYVLLKTALDAHMPSGMINMFRGIIFAGLILVFFRKSISHLGKIDIKVGIIAGVINFLGYQLQAVGLKYTTPGNSAFLTATYIVMIPFVLLFISKKIPEYKSIIAILICFIGTLFLTNTISNGFSFQLGDSLTLLSALFYALQIVYFSNTASNINPFVISFLLGVVQAIGSGLWSVLFESQHYNQINWSSAIWPVIILGIVASFGGQTLQVVGQKYTDATSSGLILMTESLFGSLFSVFLGFESLTNNLLIGGVLITFSIILMQLNSHTIAKLIKNRRINFSKNK